MEARRLLDHGAKVNARDQLQKTRSKRRLEIVESELCGFGDSVECGGQ